MKTHVFLMQVHKDIILFERIIQKLQSENHWFVVNVDKKSKEKSGFYSIGKKYNNVVFLNEMNIMHGGFSQIECTIKQINYVFSELERFDYIHTISGQDYPCVYAKQFDDFFENNMKSYMWLDTEEEMEAWRHTKYSHRLEHWYYMDIFNSSFFNKIHFAGILRRLTYWIKRPFKYDSLLWGGWNWFSLEYNVVQYLYSYIEGNQAFVNRFRYTTSGDELFFSSILKWVADEMNIETRNALRYVEWKPKREYSSLPLLLDEREYHEIVSSGNLFCRKVDSHFSKKLLQMIDDHDTSM